MWIEAVMASEEFHRAVVGGFVFGGVLVVVGLMVSGFTEMVGEIIAVWGGLIWILTLATIIALPLIRVSTWVVTGA